MPFNKDRNSRDDKSKKNYKSDRPESTDRFKTDRNSSTSSTSSSGYKKKDDSSFNRERKPYGDRNSTGERKTPYGSREGSSSSYGNKKPYGSRSEGAYGDKRPYGTRSEGDGKPYGDRRENYGDRKPFGKKEGTSYGDRKPWDDKREVNDRKKSFQKKDHSFEGRKAYGEKRPFGGATDNDDRKPSIDRKKSFDGERKHFGNRDTYAKKDGSSLRKRNDKPEENRNYGHEFINDDQIKLKSRSSNKSFKKEDDLIRLNRFISNAGICSRRKADELIAAGVVSVNGEPITELGTKINPATDQVRYNGELLKRGKMVYVLLNKPKDYITTTDDPQERKTVMDLVDKATNDRIYPVGRLDRNTTGLLLLTNDGDLADKLSHPKNSISKIYNVELDKNLSQGDFNKIAFGIELEDGFIKPDDIRYVSGGSKNEIGIQIHSGKNRIVRRIFESLGYEVVKLDRVIYANLTKKDLTRGRWRYLTEQEIIQLKHFTKG
ncbi:rRNA pseudouridine synthase [Pedobacter sp. SD-b]|uniref:Pseudouridine synthase n=1 Tax=Pedobacter segetis TaxID=2793069 RepID=A0ABS1BG78_9SPHI|nr:pseudouridine synthase [Pedobacter segetis]MBK0381852.1 rRNA pseudouridine synthase [Pedobacter segetis]